ncbi:MAG: hypothetical protein ACRD3E_09760 [Terriglobales bacterium]
MAKLKWHVIQLHELTEHAADDSRANEALEEWRRLRDDNGRAPVIRCANLGPGNGNLYSVRPD